MPSVRVGTAGWAIPRAVADRLPREGTQLQRYAARLSAAEINSSFHRPHRRSTYERWAASVGADFRFAVKLPRAITHDRRLDGCGELLAKFADEVAGLGPKRGPLLVQLPPSFAFAGGIADAFFTTLAALLPGAVACEPRHASWFEADADALFLRHRIARVAAHPAPVPAAAQPGGWPGLAYFRLHGAPRTYWSAYSGEEVAAHAEAVRGTGAAEAWLIYDNTASGAALADALELADRLAC